MSKPNVFLTGFPGFLGSALLERVVARGDGPVACLVQPRYLDLARQRADEVVSAVEGADEDAIRLHEGDITEPDLGLDADESQFGSVSEVYHLAAVYDLGVDADLAEAVNVRGTEHVLAFAGDLGVDRFHHVSTCYVSGRYDGVFTEEHLREGQTFNNHYEETKYRAEVAVQNRMEEGFPAVVYRPAITVGDSTTGETDKFDGPYNLLRLLLAQPPQCSAAFAPLGAWRTELNVVPRDFVVDAVARLSRHEDAVGSVFQLCDPRPLTVPQFVRALGDAAGHRTVTLPAPKRVARASTGLLGRAGVHVDPDTLAYLDHPTRYACPNTRRALEGSGIDPPPFETYADALVEYALGQSDLHDDEPMA